MKKTELTFTVIISILLGISSIFSTTQNKLTKYIQIATYIIAIVYFIIRIIKKKPIKIIQNKLDIGVIGLVMSTSIPLIFNTYVSLTGTIQAILKYIVLLMIYILFREVVNNNQKFYKIISKILIVSTVILIFIGIDGITNNVLGEVLKNVGLGSFSNGEDRLISTFGYANVFAAYIASIIFLNFNECLENNKKEIKSIYKTITLILTIGLVLTYSKGIFLIFPFVLCAYVFFIKEKNKKIEIIQNIVISAIMTLVYIFIFEKLYKQYYYLVIWIEFIIIILINYIINIIFEKIDISKIKLNVKKIIIISIVACGVFILYIVIGLNQIIEYKVFTKTTISNYDAKIINNIKGNTAYLFKFDLNSIAPNNDEKAFKINLKQRDNKNQEINNTEIQFGTYNGNKEIKIVTYEQTREIKIEFISKYEYIGKALTIKTLKINDKEYPLQYKYLPTKLVEKIRNININYKTAQERIEVIKDALNLSKENFITGIGGNGWQCKYKEIQSYNYIVEKIHSYPAKVILEFGLLGIISYLWIGICLIKILIKNKDIKLLSILFAIIIMLLHSSIDLNMEYTHILIFVFGLIAIISANEGKRENGKKKDIIVNITIIILMIISIYFSINKKVYDRYSNITDLLRQRNGLRATSEEYSQINQKIINEYEKIIKYERYNYFSSYYNIIRYYLDSSIENDKEQIERYYIKIKDKSSNNLDYNIQKIRFINDIIELMEKKKDSQYYNLIEKFVDIILNEYNELLPKVENREDIMDLERIYDNVNKIKEQYLFGIRVLNDTDKKIDVKQLQNIEIEKNRKDILIYHTHASESYKADEKYKQYDFYKTLNKNYSIIQVGNTLTDLLKNKEVNVIHHSEYYDFPSVEGAYERAEKNIKEILLENSNIDIIFDIHRDAYSDTEHIAKTVNLDGEKVAKLRFVIGTNNKDWTYKLKFAIEIQKLANEKYPGLFDAILVRNLNYNQNLAKYAMLIEVGENCNTIDEATASMKYFSEIICEILQGN